MRGLTRPQSRPGGHQVRHEQECLLLSHVDYQLELVNERRGRELWEASQARLLGRPADSMRHRMWRSIVRIGARIASNLRPNSGLRLPGGSPHHSVRAEELS